MVKKSLTFIVTHFHHTSFVFLSHLSNNSFLTRLFEIPVKWRRTTFSPALQIWLEQQTALIFSFLWETLNTCWNLWTLSWTFKVEKSPRNLASNVKPFSKPHPCILSLFRYAVILKRNFWKWKNKCVSELQRATLAAAWTDFNRIPAEELLGHDFEHRKVQRFLCRSVLFWHLHLLWQCHVIFARHVFEVFELIKNLLLLCIVISFTLFSLYSIIR